MAKQSRDIYNPITVRDWFLYHLFNDRDFVEIRKQWQDKVNDIDQEPGKEPAQRTEINVITAGYTELLRQKFNINEATALKGLKYTKRNRILNEDRIPTAEIQDGRVIISVGADTRFEDIESLWTVWASRLQTKLPGYVSQRSAKASQPLLAYVVHRCLLDGQKMVDIHKRYEDGTLDSRIPSNATKTIQDFRKDYKEAVKGYINPT